MRLTPQVNYVYIHAEPRVVRKIIAGIVRIRVQHNVVGIPIPVARVPEIRRSDLEVRAVKPEPIRTAAAEAVDVAGTEMSFEVAMFPGTIQAVVATIGSVSYPAAVCFDVRSIWVTGLVGEVAAAIAASVARFRPSPFSMSCRCRAALRNVAAAGAPLLVLSLATAVRVTSAAIAFVLCEKNRTDSNQSCYQPTRCFHLLFPSSGRPQGPASLY